MQQHSKLDIVDEKYQRTLVYGIICLITGEMYVGSTHSPLDERIRLHIQLRDCSAWQILERGNYKAYVIQHWPCNTKRDVLSLEGGWQKAYRASFPDHFVNKKIEGFFSKESPENAKAYCLQYNNEHREERRQKDTKRYEENIDTERARSLQYYHTHKEEKQAYTKKPWTCEWCNKTMTTGGKAKHKKKYCKSKPSE
jgi:hypothetical protein